MLNWTVMKQPPTSPMLSDCSIHNWFVSHELGSVTLIDFFAHIFTKSIRRVICRVCEHHIKEAFRSKVNKEAVLRNQHDVSFDCCWHSPTWRWLPCCQHELWWESEQECQVSEEFAPRRGFLLPVHSKQCAPPQLLTEQLCLLAQNVTEWEFHSRMKWKPWWTFCCPCHQPNHCYWLQEVSIQVVLWRKWEQVLIPCLPCQEQIWWSSTFLCKQAEQEISMLLSILSQCCPNQFWNAPTNTTTFQHHFCEKQPSVRLQI